MYLYLSIIFLTLSSFVLHGQTKYFSYLNNFDYFNKDSAVIENNQLIQKNNSLNRQFNVISLSEFSDIYKIYIKVANKNNKEGSIIKIIDDFGKSHAITNPEFGIVWNYIDDKNYDEAINYIGDKVDLVIPDNGYLAKGIASTVVGFKEDEITIFRQGEIIV